MGREKEGGRERERDHGGDMVRRERGRCELDRQGKAGFRVLTVILENKSYSGVGGVDDLRVVVWSSSRALALFALLSRSPSFFASALLPCFLAVARRTERPKEIFFHFPSGGTERE